MTAKRRKSKSARAVRRKPARPSRGRRKTERLSAASVPPRGQRREREHVFLRLSELLGEGLVKMPLAAGDRWGAVDELLRVLVAEGELPAGLAAEAEASVREREAIRPTGWKYGLAFPNGRLPGLKRIVAAVGISPGGIDFSCRDGLPARIVVLILFPQGCYARFAPAIRDIAEGFEEAPLREALLGAREPAEVVEAIEEAESRETA